MYVWVCTHEGRCLWRPEACDSQSWSYRRWKQFLTQASRSVCHAKLFLLVALLWVTLFSPASPLCCLNSLSTVIYTQSQASDSFKLEQTENQDVSAKCHFASQITFSYFIHANDDGATDLHRYANDAWSLKWQVGSASRKPLSKMCPLSLRAGLAATALLKAEQRKAAEKCFAHTLASRAVSPSASPPPPCGMWSTEHTHRDAALLGSYSACCASTTPEFRFPGTCKSQVSWQRQAYLGLVTSQSCWNGKTPATHVHTCTHLLLFS